MTHIGILSSYDSVSGSGIIIDAHRLAHLFHNEFLDSKTKISFVTYEGEGEIVSDIIDLKSYPRYYSYQDSTFYLQDNGFTYFLINKKGERYELWDSERYIVETLFKKDDIESYNPAPSTLGRYIDKKKEIILDKNVFDEKIKELNELVNYVDKHKEEIAESYRVNISTYIHYKVGGDDSIRVKRKTILSYRDCYINRFFDQDEILYSERGYSIDTTHPFGDGRRVDIENKDKQRFLANYNKNEHLYALIYDYFNAFLVELVIEKQDQIDFASKWGYSNEYHKLYEYTTACIKAYNEGGMKYRH